MTGMMGMTANEVLGEVLNVISVTALVATGHTLEHVSDLSMWYVVGYVPDMVMGYVPDMVLGYVPDMVMISA